MCIRLTRVLCGFLLVSSQVLAQGPQGRMANRLPEVGSSVPKVSAFDEQGQVVSTASLRGSYTVLVFGCLT